MSARAAFVLCALLPLACPAPAQKAAPRFQDFPAMETYNGRNAPVVLTRRDAEFRTRLRQAASQKPNFADHYILTSWGCGAGCLMGAIIDANSGRVSWFPFTVCCWPAEVDQPIGYRLDSRLIVFTGWRNEKDGDDGPHYYEVRDGKLVEISRRQ